MTIEAEGLQQVDVYDATGRMTICVPAESNQTRIGLDDLMSGDYIIIVKSKEGMGKRRLIKQ